MGDLIVPTVTLDRGVTMPTIGFGTAHLTDETAAQAAEEAFAAGYRKVDTATAYTNETGVGRAIARKRGLTAAQVVLAWHLQRGTTVIPRSQDPARIRANLATLDVSPLHNADLSLADKLDRDHRLGPHPDEFDGR